MSSNYHLGNPLSGVKILDVGCGGGLLSEVRKSVPLFLSLKSIQSFRNVLLLQCLISNPLRRGFSLLGYISY